MSSPRRRARRARVDSPRIAIVTTATLALLVLASYVVPQRLTGSEPTGLWADDTLWAAVEALGLDHIFTTWWFAAILALFLTALTVSAVRQARQALVRTTRGPSGGWVRIGAVHDRSQAQAIAGHRGFVRRRGEERWSKHVYGYWGATLLHAGIVLAIVFALVVTLTQQRGTMTLAEGESRAPGGGWLIEEHGVLADELELDTRVTLTDVSVEYWDEGGVRALQSVLDVDGDRVETSVKSPVRHDGLRWYQSQSYGHAFFVVLADPGGRSDGLRLEIVAPSAPDQASYADYDLGNGRLLRAKYYLDVDRRSMSGTPELVLRLEQDGAVIDETALVGIGEQRAFAGGQVTLVDARMWSEIIAVSDHGVTPLFVAFGVLLLGSVLIYLTPPRELRLRACDGALCLEWSASRMRDHLADEIAELTADLEGASPRV
ncbi:MAG: cytochrome c biogenesis protein ResB [Coriobacteriia bacterium]